jgi:hypothetical protein
MNLLLVVLVVALILWKPRAFFRTIFAVMIAILTLAAWGSLIFALVAFMLTVVPTKWKTNKRRA